MAFFKLGSKNNKSDGVWGEGVKSHPCAVEGRKSCTLLKCPERQN
jgi:hypothetical protein